jgi:hypothetical protein
MRVTIRRSEEQRSVKRGWFKYDTYTVYNVWPEIELSEEERAVIQQRKLWEMTVFVHKIDHSHDAPSTSAAQAMVNSIDSLEMSVDHLVNNPQKYVFTHYYDIVQANNFAQRLEREILPRLKKLITSTTETPRDKTFEL